MILERPFVHVVTVNKFVTRSVRITVTRGREVRGAIAPLEEMLSELHSLSLAETVSTPNRYPTNNAVESVNLKRKSLNCLKCTLRSAQWLPVGAGGTLEMLLKGRLPEARVEL